MVAIVLPNANRKDKVTSTPAGACPLCFGFYEDGPNQGQRYPLCLSCREEAARLAGVHDPRLINKAWTGSAHVTLAKAEA